MRDMVLSNGVVDACVAVAQKPLDVKCDVGSDAGVSDVCMTVDQNQIARNLAWLMSNLCRFKPFPKFSEVFVSLFAPHFV